MTYAYVKAFGIYFGCCLPSRFPGNPGFVPKSRMSGWGFPLAGKYLGALPGGNPGPRATFSLPIERKQGGERKMNMAWRGLIWGVMLVFSGLVRADLPPQAGSA